MHIQLDISDSSPEVQCQDSSWELSSPSGSLRDDMYEEVGVLDLLQRLEVSQGGDFGAVIEGLAQEFTEVDKTVRVEAQCELTAETNRANDNHQYPASGRWKLGVRLQNGWLQRDERRGVPKLLMRRY